MCKGTIFNIQKFSIHDGPGIRTTVFFKGCPLRCTWCANPESQQNKIQILHEQKKCTMCKKCLKKCSVNAIEISDSGYKINHDKCIQCRQCVDACPSRSLSVEGKTPNIDEIVKRCLDDLDFYIESDGGVTLSGGEVLSQPQFARALISALKKENIHVAIETSGYASLETFQSIATKVDYIMFDVKHYDSLKHIEGTAVSNKRIIKNLKWALENHINLLVRIPVIPNFNETIEDANHFVTLFQEIGLTKVQLLPFHQFGENKYDALHLVYPYKNVKALHKEDLLDYQAVFINHNIECIF